MVPGFQLNIIQECEMRQLEYLVVAQLAARYRSIITQNIVKLSMLPDKCNGEHLVRLCSEMINNGKTYP